LPLRRTESGDEARRWVCGGCCGRYLGIFDNGSPADIMSNARPG
jgi:hypothetical protein